MGYAAPRSVGEATKLLGSTPSARVFAGATDLLPQFQAGRSRPDLMIDIKRIPRLTAFQKRGSTWTIGAATPAARIVEEQQFGMDFPGVSEAVALIGSNQIQSRASLGGNLCNASPAADTVPALLVNDAQVVIATVDGTRSMPAEYVATGPGQTSLEDGEFVIEFALECRPPGTSDAYLRFIPRTEMDIAVVGAAASVTLDESGKCLAASLVLGAVAPTAIRVSEAEAMLVGRRIDDDLLNELAVAASAACRPIDDKRGTIDFRRKVAGVLTRRVVRIAALRAGGDR
ncbi:MAG: FAD binding domain-containing protein [Acidimicrobiia bacterium]